MLYNKNNVRKTNDKKILHKVGKQWKVVSVALLMAIGGGAVATHVANAQSNNSNNDATELAQLNKETVQAPTSVAANNNKQSASASSSAQSTTAPSSFVSGNNGKAAEYNYKANSVESGVQSASNLVNSYVKSLNAKFPTAYNIANTKMASAKSAEASDNAMAAQYSGIAKNSANSAKISSLASKAGFTPNDFANYVSWNANNNSAAVKSAKSVDGALVLASSVAYAIAGNNWNAASSVANSNAASVEAKYNIASDMSGAASSANSVALSSAQSASAKNSNDLSSATSESINASVATDVAKGLTQSAMSDVDVVAKYLNTNPAAVNSAVTSYAKSDASASSYVVSGVATLSNGSTSSNGVSQSSAFSAMKGAISNSSAMSSAAAATAKDNSVIASANAHSAIYSAAVSSASAATSKANKDFSLASDAKEATSIAAAVTSTMDKNMTSNNSGAFIQDVLANTNNESNLINALGVSGLNLNSLKSNSDEALMLGSMASAEGVNVLALKSNASNIKSAASAAKVALSGNYSVSNLNSVANSMAQSAANVTISAEKSSADYAQSNDTDVVLASSYASSYANDASSEANYVSEVATGLGNFYASNTDAKFASASNVVKNASSEANNYRALANGYGLKTWFNAPKYITVLKDGLLHQSVDYGSNNDAKLTGVKAGQKLNVLAIGIANNGALRYRVSVNGKTGFFTSNPGYVKATYLPSNKANGKQSFTMLTSARVFRNANRTQATGKTVKAGDVLKDASVVSVDGIYGGYTAIETANGEFVTANTNCVEVTPAANNNNNATNNGNNTNNNNQTVYFG